MVMVAKDLSSGYSPPREYPYGFQPYPGMSLQAMTPWYNQQTGQEWTAHNLGFSNPDPNWVRGRLPTDWVQPTQQVAPSPMYRLEGPNDVPSSGNRISPLSGQPQFAPGQTFAPNMGAWAPTRPEFLDAPGYETYAPTKAYGYSPTGGDWSGGYGGSGGGGGLTSGDFGGGTDTSTLGNALSALSLLGGANSLSGLLTGKSLLEHAGIPNPFSNFLGGGDGLSFTDYLPNAIKDALNIYPSQGGLLTPGGGTALLTPLQGEAMVNALGGTGPGTLSSQFTEAMNAAGGPWPQSVPVQSLTPPSYPVSPYQNLATTPIDVAPLGDPSPGMNVANAIAEAQAQQAAMTQQAMMDLGGIQALGHGTTMAPNLGLPAAQWGGALPGGVGGTVGVGPSGYLSADALAGVSNLGAIPAFASAGYLGAPMSGFASGALTGGALGGPGSAAAGSFAGAALPLALAMYGMKRMAPDPTADPRMANQLENYFQRALKSPEQEAIELENLKQQVFANPASIQVMKLAAEGGVPGATHRSGGADIVGWKDPVAAKFRELLPELEAVKAESEQANYGGMYNIGEYGLMGKAPNPYTLTEAFGKNLTTQPLYIDEAAIAAGMMDDPRVKKKKETDPGTIAGGP